MQDGVAALARHNQACLDGVGAVKNLFRRMTHHDIRFQIDPLLLGAFADGDETSLVALALFIENRVELRALGRLPAAG